MKDIVIQVDGDAGIILKCSLWFLITEMLFDIGYKGDIKLFIDGEEVEKPIEMEEGE